MTRPSPANLTPGSKLALRARLLGYPLPRVTWEKNGAALNSDERVRLHSEDNCHVIEVDSVNYSDAGVYKITARNPLGKQHAQTTVTISRDGDSVDSLSHSNLPANQSRAPIGAKVAAWPADNYFALSRDVDSASTTSSRSIQSLQVSLEAVSVQSKVSEKSENSFTQNLAAEASNRIRPAPSAPAVIEPLSDKVCALNDYVTLECRISGGVGDPDWTFNGEKELPNGTVFRTFGEVYRLRLRGLQEEQFGWYTITVKNAVGQTSRIRRIGDDDLETVEMVDRDVLAEKNENIKVGKLAHPPTQLIQPVNKPPTIKQALRDVVAQEGETIELTARITGHPKRGLEIAGFNCLSN